MPRATKSMSMRSFFIRSIGLILPHFEGQATGGILETQMQNSRSKMTAFAKFACTTLAFNLVVILWGVFLRASHSGDGCGQHWLTCQGEVIPSAPELKTVIEYSHRISTAIAGLVVIGLVIWA